MSGNDEASGPGGPGDAPDEQATPEGWTFLDRAIEYETGWYTGGYDLFEQPDGSEKKYYWAELPPAVVVLARDGAEVVMIEQYRPAIGRECLELVAGIVEDCDVPEERRGGGGGAAGADAPGERLPPGEAVPASAYESAARRELQEEAGVHANETAFVEDFWCSTGVLRHRRGHVVAWDLDPAERALDTNEFIEVTRVPVDEVLERARTEPSNDATIEGVLLAREEGLLE